VIKRPLNAPINIYDTASLPIPQRPITSAMAYLRWPEFVLAGPGSLPPAPPAPAAGAAAVNAQGPFSASGVIPPLKRHLHFGGSPVNTNGGLGYKPEKNRTFKVQKRLELIVQLENAAMPEAATATMLCISVPRLRTIKKSADYLKTRMRLTYGIVVDHEAKLAQVKEQRKDILTSMLPQALQVIANVINNPAPTLSEKKLQVAVAQDIMDRQGDLAKISRTEVKPVSSFDWNPLDATNQSIFDVIRGAATARFGQSSGATHESQIEDTLELSKAFSESSTIDIKEQQEALELLEKFQTNGAVN
jgi:hypothetical protein